MAAYTSWVEGYRDASIVFSKESYDKYGEKEVDLLICHELFHLLVAPVDDTLRDYVGTQRVYHQYSRENETAADRFAMILTRAYARKRES